MHTQNAFKTKRTQCQATQAGRSQAKSTNAPLKGSDNSIDESSRLLVLPTARLNNATATKQSRHAEKITERAQASSHWSEATVKPSVAIEQRGYTLTSNVRSSRISM